MELSIVTVMKMIDWLIDWYLWFWNLRKCWNNRINTVRMIDFRRIFNRKIFPFGRSKVFVVDKFSSTRDSFRFFDRSQILDENDRTRLTEIFYKLVINILKYERYNNSKFFVFLRILKKNLNFQWTRFSITRRIF